MPRKPGRRAWGSGGITWITMTKVRLAVRVTDQDGVRRAKTKTVQVSRRDQGGRGEARVELEKFIEELSRPGPKDSPTVLALLTEYRQHCQRIGRSQSTIESYEYVEKRLGDFGKMRAAEVTTHDVDTFYGTLALAPRTIQQTHAVLRAAFAQAITWGYVQTNPVVAATAPNPRELEARPLAVADVRKMIGSTDDVVLAFALILASVTGCRRGELCGLRWDDLDADNAVLTVERQWVPGKGGQYLSVPKSKGGVRVIDLDDLMLGIFDRYRIMVTGIVGFEPEGWLLSDDGGTTPLRAKTLGQRIKVLAEACDVKATTHTFRKVTATQLVAAGVDVDTASRRMGHTKEVMFGSYSLGARDQSKAAAGALAARLVDQGLPLGELLRPKETP